MSECNLVNNYLPLPVVLKRGKGVWLWDVQGKKYIDMMSCYSAMAFGHSNPDILKALEKQAKLLVSPSRAYYTDQLALWSEEITEFCGMETVLPMNSGVEAVETAIKIARKWGYARKGVEKDKAEIIVCEGNFHGRTTTVISFSTEAQYKDGFGPFTPGFKVIPYGDIGALELSINKNTAGFLVEPIQGEAGIRIPEKGFLKKAYDICRENNVLLMIDEIQTGFCRTGRTFCFEHELYTVPDILIVGKALGGGLPISAVLAWEDISGVIEPGDHGSTFGGNPLACAVSRKVLKLLKKHNLNKRVSENGSYFLERLQETIGQNRLVEEIRGKGLLLGIELNPKAGGARRYCEKLAELGVLTKETHEHVIRLAPPLIIKKEEIDFTVERLKKIFGY
ncbi:MAG: ornithine--oxo-acid transaminase [Candidatus Nealsonbacteria bacterium]|nr:ornithine--oxo-acid transaminase [Candidatus Nealsonbacteria bacterium]